MSAALVVERAGIRTTVQDLGREGRRSQGVPPSGALDLLAARAANLCVDNREDDAVLEVTLAGPTLRATGDLVLAVTGSPIETRVDGTPVPNGCAFRVPAGARVALGRVGAGLRAYLAVRGGVHTAVVLGSRASTPTAALGPPPLADGDVLPVGAAAGPGRLRRLLPGALPPLRDLVRVVPGPQVDRFHPEALETFFTAAWRVSARADRAGIVLEGPALRHLGAADLAPEGVAPGSVQVPGDGAPIVLLADGPVTGGYPKIATVIAADLGRLAHARPGATLRFAECGVEEARAVWRLREEALRSRIEELA